MVINNIIKTYFDENKNYFGYQTKKAIINPCIFNRMDDFFKIVLGKR